MTTNNILAGLGGALVLTILNESLKNLDNKMPRIDLVGEEAVRKTASFFGVDIQNKEALIGTTLVTDIVSNTAYYSLINDEGNDLWFKAASSGLVAGLGAVSLPEQVGLNDKPVAKSFSTKAMTMGYYMVGALTTAAVFRFLQRFENK